MNDQRSTDGIACTGCGHRMAATRLACPVCHQLVHAARLKTLSQNAAAMEAQDDVVNALATWRDALILLPEDSKQHMAIHARVQVLSQRVDSDPSLRKAADEKAAKVGAGKSLAKSAAGLGAAGLFIWKFKFILGFVLTKGKLLLMGLTKTSTLFTMIAAFGLYWTVWGWKFALGLVLSIYVHEMGHVAALRRFGIRASAPAFIPGVGAMVRMKHHPASPLENARVGLAGPIWGLGAAMVAFLIFLATDQAIFAAIARVGAWINLFNLLPMLPLDGGRGFQALNRQQRWIAVAAIGGAWFFSGEGLLLLLLIAGGIYACTKPPRPQSDATALYQYIGLLAALSWMSTLSVPIS